VTSFLLVPVIDLLQGEVVHAREGRRSEYAPVQSKLCEGAAPDEVVAALLSLFAFRTVYVADLDAIQHQSSNHAVLTSLHEQFPDIEFWVDAGIAEASALEHWIAAGLGPAVIGSESLRSADTLSAARERDPAIVLSLDFLGGEFRGPPVLLAHPERYWPQRVLAMNLQRVGSRLGPDFALVVELARRVAGCQVYAAGGVRSIEDLEQLAKAGASGALIASALHDGRIGAAELTRFLEGKSGKVKG
jgi:phosphoribosylformimino-5-aminoimidazole carboxamide ribotide isomerase